jgi:hypothetical protein
MNGGGTMMASSTLIKLFSEMLKFFPQKMVISKIEGGERRKKGGSFGNILNIFYKKFRKIESSKSNNYWTLELGMVQWVPNNHRKKGRRKAVL